MFFNKVYFFILVFFLVLGITFFNFSVLKKEYRLINIHMSLFQNLVTLNAENYIEKFKINFYKSKKNGLPIVDLFMPKKSNAILNSNFPKNAKKWVSGYLKYPDGEYRKVKYRYRGDANNFSYQQKTYRIKLKKKNLIESKRLFNYLIPNTENTFSKYLSYYLGKQIDLPVPDARFVEMRTNGSNSSVFIEIEHLDEGFLRRHNFMPVNLYKGEQAYDDEVIEKGNALFNNPSLWSKTAIFNQRDEENFEDLKSLISLIRSSQTSASGMNELYDLIEIKLWAKFDALQTILQSNHNDEDHNQRIISDIWKGKFLPVVFEMSTEVDNPEVIDFEIEVNSLLGALRSSPEFLSLKYKYLYDFLDNNLLSKSTYHLDEIKNQLAISWTRDINKKEIPKISKWNSKSDLNSMIIKWDKFSDNLIKREKAILQILNQPSDSSWNLNGRILSISTNGVVPLIDPTFTIIKSASKNPPKIYFDIDNDGLISKNDINIPIIISGDQMQIKASFFSNKNVARKASFLWPRSISSNTVFNLISDQEFKISSGLSNHYFNHKEYDLVESSSLGQTPTKNNIPLIEKIHNQEIWEGEIQINDTKIINHPVKIMPGTNIIMAENANIIFKNHVQALGSRNSIIKFSGGSNKPWGTIALLGEDANNSNFSHVTIEGGSGYEAPNIKFTGMFSLHDVKDITLQNLKFKKNSLYDDLIHIVYSQNILLKNCVVFNALFDAIDIDMSSVKIDNCDILSSGNDGIDSMSSEVKIKNSFINGSLDKGISVGENSEVFVLKSKITDNKIGIESKDNSSVSIHSSSFLNNELDLNAYKKNWQYGNGGRIILLDNSLKEIGDNIQIDKHSELNIYEDSKLDKPKDRNLNYNFNSNKEFFSNNSIKHIFNSWEEDYQDYSRK
jgi:hypothetical protein